MLNLKKLYSEKIKDDKFIEKFESYIITDKMISYSDVKEWIG